MLPSKSPIYSDSDAFTVCHKREPIDAPLIEKYKKRLRAVSKRWFFPRDIINMPKCKKTAHLNADKNYNATRIALFKAQTKIYEANQ